MVLDKLESILNVRANEWRETSFFWFFTFLCWFSMGLGDAISDTLFIKRAGVENLPAMFMVCSLFAIPVSVLLTLMHGRVEKRHLTMGAGLISGLAIAAAVEFILESDQSSTTGCYVLYFICNLLMFVMPVVLSVLMGTQFNALKAKRLLPIIFTGVIGGRIAAGLSLNWLAASYPVPKLLWVWLGIHGLAFIFFLVGSGSFIKPQIQSFFTQVPERKKVKVSEKLKVFVRSLADSRLVLFLVLSAVCANVSYYFAEFQSASIFSRHFTSENDLARFYGLFTIFASLFAFLFQGIITGNLIQRLGISNTNLIYPGLVLASFSGTAASFSLIPGTGLKFIQVGLQNALYQPVNILFYNALPPREKARIITVNEGIIQPLGTVMTGLLLFYVDKSGEIVRFFPLLAAGFWFGVAILM
ncbi:MAG: Npt1/Npt2 family nucleotide transporter, partial [Candidatus Riflebacteria bacterium]|nr:Npt1/Npt2 family nucleotide transporter [Candidatus Riflebacteria bacterium]